MIVVIHEDSEMEMDTTYFYSGGRPHTDVNNGGLSADSYISDTGDHEIMTMPIRPPRPTSDTRNVVFVSPPYPGYIGYNPTHQLPGTMEPGDPFMSNQQMNQKRNASKNRRQRHCDAMAKQLAIAMGVLCFLALVAAIFSAIYFGHDSNNKSKA